MFLGPESPPLKDAVATTCDVEFADMEDVEADNGSGEDAGITSLSQGFNERLILDKS